MLNLAPPTVEKTKIGANQALAHRSGTLTDDMLIILPDAELEKMGYDIEITLWSGKVFEHEYKDVPIKRIKAVRSEYYKAPMIKKKAEEQGHSAGEIYLGVHRAVLILDQRKEERIQESQQRKTEDKESLDSLINQPYAE